MREARIRIKFTAPCLGNVRKPSRFDPQWPEYYMQRMPDQKAVRFEPNWWKSGLRFAARLLSQHQRAVERILFDAAVDGEPDETFFRRYIQKQRYISHEAYMPGRQINVNCVAPSELSDSDLAQLMSLLGKYRGISPFRDDHVGRFDVVSVSEIHRPTQDDKPVILLRPTDGNG